MISVRIGAIAKFWDYAAVNGLTIVSKDADFSARALAASDPGPKVIHVRVGNLRIEQLHQYLTAAWPDVCRASEASRLVQVYRDRIESVG